MKAIDFVITRDSCRFIFDDGSEKEVSKDTEEYNVLFKEVIDHVHGEAPLNPTDFAPEPDVVPSEMLEAPLESKVEDSQVSEPALEQDKELSPIEETLNQLETPSV